MDAVEYIKEAKRICKSRSVCKSVSSKCPLLDENGHCTATADICDADIIEKQKKLYGLSSNGQKTIHSRPASASF